MSYPQDAIEASQGGEMPTGSTPGSRHAQYQVDVASDVGKTIEELGCQPILFVGSGLSKRYFSGPSWDELLAHLAETCPLIDKEYAYYKQTLRSPLAVGAEFARRYQEWAWSTGRNRFPESMYQDDVPVEGYIKFKVAEYLSSLTPSSLAGIENACIKDEISVLQNIKPHAIITTNYDQFPETIFPDYAPIVGQQVIRGSFVSVGEILKIHGCVSAPDSLVLTQSDYDEFMKKKKYLSAKLLTYFSEHPLLFIGYGAGDPNIRSILSDIDEALPVAGGLIGNVYVLEWRNNVSDDEYPSREKLIAIEDAKSVRLKAIEATDFDWVFRAFGSQHTLTRVNPKILRALLARSYELVRHDVPRTSIQADFQMLEHAVANSESFAKLFGLTTVRDPSVLSAQYPYTLTDVSKKIGGNEWHLANVLIQAVKANSGFDIKASDNTYHCAVKCGRKAVVHKYSESVVDLLTKVRDALPYEI
jgi:SIR2-like domain